MCQLVIFRAFIVVLILIWSGCSGTNRSLNPPLRSPPPKSGPARWRTTWQLPPPPLSGCWRSSRAKPTSTPAATAPRVSASKCTACASRSDGSATRYGWLTQTCLCEGCKNHPDNMERSEAIYEIVSRDPYAFSRKVSPVPDSQAPCNCRRSNCVKKYCDCFKRGRQCTPLCRCVECRNPDVRDRAKGEEGQGEGERAPSKMVKV